MKKVNFLALVILMSFSLIGILIVQGYWIKRSIAIKEDQFAVSISEILLKVSEKITNREIVSYYNQFSSLPEDSIGAPKETRFKNIIFLDQDLNTKETHLYSHKVLEKDFSMGSDFFDNQLGLDSILKGYSSEQTKITLKEDFGLDGNNYTITPIETYTESGRMSAIDRAMFEELFRQHAGLVPIHKRISKQELELALLKEFEERGLDLDFEYGIYSKDLPTRIKSDGFVYNPNSTYKAPMFMDADGNSDFTLHLHFPNKNAFLIKSIIGMSLLSFLFGSIILFVFISAVYQWIKQKKISEIKSDFINNMTHEFKTPIATINLAVEAIKNPKINSDQEKIIRYANMIRDENNRMHAQVENVLQISKLDKNELDIKMEEVDIHEIIEDAIAHVNLIVSDRKGLITTHFDLKNTELMASEMHMTNVIVNILENASKYSPEVPIIDVYTREKNNQIEIAIQDHGAGMSKQVLKQVFDKFYREPTGNIHNIKGHGLGLAYVKKIVELHKGTVYAESEVGKGSTFYIHLPFKK